MKKFTITLTEEDVDCLKEIMEAFHDSHAGMTVNGKAGIVPSTKYWRKHAEEFMDAGQAAYKFLETDVMPQINKQDDEE